MQVADRESEIAKQSEIFKNVTPDSPMKVWQRKTLLEVIAKLLQI